MPRLHQWLCHQLCLFVPPGFIGVRVTEVDEEEVDMVGDRVGLFGRGGSVKRKSQPPVCKESSKKVNFVVALLRGMLVQDALMQLHFTIKPAAKTVYQVLILIVPSPHFDFNSRRLPLSIFIFVPPPRRHLPINALRFSLSSPPPPPPTSPSQRPPPATRTESTPTHPPQGR
ncbi:hypothetical protein Fmac_001431 [Flemingia macrophylla]|uniref:Uncharacterized protein n=1 Tax=Flemingia macrophylla TaxID=520843 RepID=A0ABD1NHK0_9FABA